MPDECWRKKFEQLRNATEDRPRDGLAWSALGDFLIHESENPKLAVRAYEQARDLLPNKDMRLRLGSAYVRTGEAERGFALMRASAEEHPRAEAYCFIADAYSRNDQDVQAEEAARRAIQLEPSFEEGYYLLGEALKDRDRENAIIAYRAAISIDNKYALAWQSLGRELATSGKLSDAIDALQMAIKLDPDDVWSHIFLANTLWKSNRIKEAEEQYVAALEITPDFPELKKWFDEFLASVKESEAPPNT